MEISKEVAIEICKWYTKMLNLAMAVGRKLGKVVGDDKGEEII